MDFFAAFFGGLAGGIVGVAIAIGYTRATGTTDPIDPDQGKAIMATLQELQEADAELGAQIDRVLAALADVGTTIDAALAADEAGDAAERDAQLSSTREKIDRIKAALDPASPVTPEELPAPEDGGSS